jgi:hypothetical protein
MAAKIITFPLKALTVSSLMLLYPTYFGTSLNDIATDVPISCLVDFGSHNYFQ